MNNYSKEEITKIIYDNLPHNHLWKEVSFDKLIFLWWATGRNSTSLRLTEDGCKAFELADIEYYEYPLVKSKDELEQIKFTGYTIEIGKKLKCPFYLGYKNQLKKSAYIRIYDSKIAMLITIYGSFAEYLNSTKK
jgi:hypothetical protein